VGKHKQNIQNKTFSDMETEQKKPEEPKAASNALDAPTDSGSTSAPAADAAAAPGPDGKPPKQPNAFKKFLKKVNVYLLLFLLVVVITASIGIVSYLNSRKADQQAALQTQGLTTDALSKLASSDVSVGNAGQTLTIQGNAIITGQTLIRSDLNVAGTIRVGGDVQVSTLTVANKANLADTQINSLQVAQNTIAQGSVTIQQGLNVGGASSFSGAVTIGQLTVSKLIMSGNGTLQVPNHIGFTGPSPSRSIGTTALGSGGTASINGSDTTGTVNINTGGGTAAGCFITLTFAKAFSNTPHVLVTPVGSGAGNTNWYVNRSTTNFSICTNNAAPTHQTFAFDYFITG
jgi:hypothetical protein